MTFGQIIGQEKAKAFLGQAMSRKRMPHAYLFTGIPGIGKTRAAMALCMALNCQAPEGGDSCGQCPTCRQIMGGNSPDFVALEPEGQNIKINQMRELNRSLGFAPLGRYRVCVLRKAETMTAAAANAFLKTLEEPPPGNILILNTTEPYDLLPTIVSRCQRVAFSPLPFQEMTDWLCREQGMDRETAALLTMISGGSLGRALRMSEGDYLQKRQAWLVSLTRLPGLSREKALGMAVECAMKAPKPGADAPERRDWDLSEMLLTWESWYRDLLVLRVGGSAECLINRDFSHKLQKAAAATIIEDLIDSLLAVNRAELDLRRNRNVNLVMEHTVLTLNRLAGRRRGRLSPTDANEAVPEARDRSE